jgi:ribonucleoside-diphosphate reductase alpha chain
MIVTERFIIPTIVKRNLRQRKESFGYGLLGHATFYRTYSRLKEDGSQERWADTVLRCVEGALSIRKTHYIMNGLRWDEDFWNQIALKMVNAIFEIRVLPPGRGLFAQGTEHVYERGSMALNNCAFSVIKHLSHDVAWVMDALMLGVGVGFDTHRHEITLKLPSEIETTYVIPDTREGWVESTRKLIESYELGSETVRFDYSLVRPYGSPIRGFGGVASGPDPLREMHEDVRRFLERKAKGTISSVRLITDIINRIAKCVIAGNVRRSALIALGRPDDTEFLNLKDYRLKENFERMHWQTGWGHTSNNSVVLESAEDFDYLPEIASRVGLGGEPGVLNLMNVQKYGRMGHKIKDDAVGINPCGEIPLENKELCNLVELFPTRCKTEAEFLEAVELATIYASSVSLLRTHNEETNAVIAKNRRIGVSISGIPDWMASVPRKSDVVRLLNTAYELVYAINLHYANQAGVPPSVRLTTIKPSGTISLLAGVSPGMHHPIYQTYIRRIKVAATSPVFPMLESAGVPYEPDEKDSKGTFVFEFPIHMKNVRSQDQVPLGEHGLRLIMMSRFWTDNAASNTSNFLGSLYFDEEGEKVPYNAEYPKRELAFKGEEDTIESWLSMTIPHVKSSSMLPFYNGNIPYRQAPYESISVEEFEKRKEAIQEIDWSKFEGSDGSDERYCTTDSCEI